MDRNGHKGYNLDKKKLDKILESKKVQINPPIEINKNETNKNSKPHKCREIYIGIVVTVTDYLYYPNEDGKIIVPHKHKKNIVYGDNIKAFAIDLMYEAYNSTDAVKNIISSITNDTINLSKGTLMKWSKNISEKMKPELEHIEKELLNSYYSHFDESQIKVNGEFYSELCACNGTHTRLWTIKSKKHEDLEKINFFNSYMGIIIKDGTNLYNGFGTGFSQCLSHIQRYLKGICDNVKHKYPKKMAKFLSKCNMLRNEFKENGIIKFDTNIYHALMREYEDILYNWKHEWMKDEKNPVYDEEREEILYFLKDFKVPATNNQAETDQRNIKIKQKIGKFRSKDGSEIYATIRSSINTYKKQKINVYQAFVEAFKGNVMPYNV
ncbi:MAG: transposase [Clostridia bacterium]|nr:transposase [Clostridia bacterium]